MSCEPIIFISYSHEDEPWLTYVKSHLAPAEAHGLIRLWDDRRIGGGNAWLAEIEKALERCAVCVFLVSRHSLSARFILDVEMKRMLERHHDKGAHLYPIVITSTVDCAPWLRRLNLRPKDGIALDLYEPGPRNRVMADLAREILDIVENTAAHVPSDCRRDFEICDNIQYNPVPHCAELRRGNSNKSTYRHFHLMPELRCGRERVPVDNIYFDFGARQLELRLKLSGCEIAPRSRVGDTDHPFIRAEGGDTWIIKGPREHLIERRPGPRDPTDVLSRLVIGNDILCGINALEDESLF